jgi:hypothetical protein
VKKFIRLLRAVLNAIFQDDPNKKTDGFPDIDEEQLRRQSEDGNFVGPPFCP